MNEQSRIDYRPRLDISPEQEAEVLASVYRFLLDHQADKAADEGCPETKGAADGPLRVEPNEKTLVNE